MTADRIAVRAVVEAPRDAVWRALTVDRASWWPDLVFDAVAGAPLVETWVEDGVEQHATGTVLDVDGPRMLRFAWSQPDWQGATTVEFRLEEHPAASTDVTVAESGFLTIAGPASLAAEHEEGWRYHLDRLAAASIRR